MQTKKVGIIGSGFSGLAAAATLAQQGYEVDLYEKNRDLGGRARKFEAEGFTFDMGPSWYWMPEVFENFYNNFGATTSDFYSLERLDPSYKVIFGTDSDLQLPGNIDGVYDLFEKLESGSAAKLSTFLAEAKYKYEVGMNEFVWKPSLSIREFFDARLLRSTLKLDMFTSISKQIYANFKNEKIRQLLEFPVLFLGAKPQKTPALYSLMNYADLELGTWYPKGGMHKIVEAMVRIGKNEGVRFYTGNAIEKINKRGNRLELISEETTKTYDYVVGAGDYHHIESKLLSTEYRNYSHGYWENRTLAPSSLLFYLGVKGKLPKLDHHNLFFDTDFDRHAGQIYDTKEWPDKPLFYACCPSKTDGSVAPPDCENLFLLVPIAAGLENDEKVMSQIYVKIMDRLENYVGQDISSKVIYKRSFCHNEFVSEYNSYKGNAYGLANTLMQTAILKPRIQNKKLKNLFYSGQMTAPGPGVPPSIISGQMIAKQIIKQNKHG